VMAPAVAQRDAVAEADSLPVDVSSLSNASFRALRNVRASSLVSFWKEWTQQENPAVFCAAGTTCAPDVQAPAGRMSESDMMSRGCSNSRDRQCSAPDSLHNVGISKTPQAATKKPVKMATVALLYAPCLA
jgi:hypothetical protein